VEILVESGHLNGHAKPSIQRLTALLEEGPAVNAATLEALLAEGETQLVECKVAPPRLAELAQRICGFANALGGFLVIGVKDQTWEIVGVKQAQESVDALLQAARLCKPSVRFDPPHPRLITLHGKHLVVAQIPPNDGQLYQIGGVCWMRRGTFTVPMEVSEIEAFLHQRGSLAWESHPVERATLADLEMDLVDAYLAQRPSRPKETGRLPNREEVLLHLGCAVRGAGEDHAVIRPTHAGLLLFGRHPQEFLIAAEVVCVLFKDALGLHRYADRRILHGTITEQIDQAERFLAQYIPVGAHIEGFHRVDEPDYPLEALRELMVNAVCHRDYSLTGEAVRVFYYPDRLEVRNPGLLMPGITLEELRQGKARSKPRNPIIASVLRDLPGGYMERLGAGIAFVIQSMRALGRPDPEFREQGEFIVTLRKSPPAAEGVLSVMEQTRTQVVSGVAPEFEGSPSVPKRPRTQEERQHMALRYVHTYGSITSGMYRKLTGAGETTATRDLEALVEKGALRAFGERRGRYYVL